MLSIVLRSISLLFRRLQLPLQVILYGAMFWLAQQLVQQLHIPLPANIVGMAMLLVLIVTKVVPVKWVKAGSRWLLAEMLLFFVPAVVAVVNYSQLLMVEGWKIFLVIALSTSMTLGATSWVVDRVYRFELSLQRRRRGQS